MNRLVGWENMTARELKAEARVRKIAGWHDMTKAQLLAVLVSPPAESGGVSKRSKTPALPSKSAPVAAKSPLSATKPPQKSDKSVVKTAEKPVSTTIPKSAPPKNIPQKSASRVSVKTNLRQPVKTAEESAPKVAAKGPVKKSDEKTVPKPASKPSHPAETVALRISEPVSPKADFLKEKLLRHKTLQTPSPDGREVQDRLVLMVCGPFWLHAWWEISATLIERIRSAMGHLWHTADPVLRLYRVLPAGSGATRREYLSDIPIHGGVYNWYISVDDPPGSFLVEIGYKVRNGQFFTLVSSNIVETPQSFSHEAGMSSDPNWPGVGALPAGFSPYDKRLLAGTRGVPTVANGALATGRFLPETESEAKPKRSSVSKNKGDREFSLAIDAEVVIKGKTSPDVQLTVKGERVWLKEDGSFIIRYNLPERRHVFPVVAVSRDGIETKTIVLAVERNTKTLETVIRDQNEDE